MTALTQYFGESLTEVAEGEKCAFLRLFAWNATRSSGNWLQKMHTGARLISVQVQLHLFARLLLLEITALPAQREPFQTLARSFQMSPPAARTCISQFLAGLRRSET